MKAPVERGSGEAGPNQSLKTAAKTKSLTNWFGPKVLTAVEVVNGVGLKPGRFIGVLTRALDVVAGRMRPIEF